MTEHTTMPAAETLAPLAAAAATMRRSEIEEYECQKVYQETRTRLNHLRGRIRSLGIQETLVQAQHRHAALATAASEALRRVRAATVQTQRAGSAAATLDAREARDVALGQLAALVGTEEAQRYSQGNERPSWLRG